MRRGAALTATVLTVLGAGAAAAPAATPACYGAASRDPERPCHNPELRRSVSPTPREALHAPNARCRPLPGAEPHRCTFGSPAEDATGVVALVGDSHATHWRSAMLTVASRRRWHGISISRSSCPFTQATPIISDERGCVRWNDEVTQFIADRPEITTVVFGQHRGRVRAAPGERPREVQIDGYLRAWEALPPSVERIVVLRDTPYARTHTGHCIQQAVRRGEEPGPMCAIPRRLSMKPDPAAQAARRSTDPRVRLIDMTEYFCGLRLCYPVVGGALVHKDSTHISLAFGLTLGPYLLRAFDAQEI